MKSDLVEFTAREKRRTDKAVCVNASGEKDGDVWLPLSQVEIRKTGNGALVIVTLPEWLAVDKGLEGYVN